MKLSRIVDRTHTKWGKARPYALAAVAMWIMAIILFSANPSWSNGVKCAYVFVSYVLTDSVFRTLAEAADPVHYRHGFNVKEQMDSVAFWGTIGGLMATLAGIFLPQLMVAYMAVQHGWTIIAAMVGIPGIVFCLMKLFFIPETEEVEEAKAVENKLSVRESMKYLFRNKYIFIYLCAPGPSLGILLDLRTKFLFGL